jgi:hypothetical protein
MVVISELQITTYGWYVFSLNLETGIDINNILVQFPLPATILGLDQDYRW